MRTQRQTFAGFPACSLRLMAIFSAYMDESEIPTTGTFVLGCYVAEKDRWESFSEQWLDVLAAYNLPYFHMKDLRSANTRLFRHLSRPARRELMSRLLAIMIQHIQVGIVAYLKPTEYKANTPKTYRTDWGSHYGFLVNQCLFTLSRVLSITTERETVGVFLEEGPLTSGGLEQVRQYKESHYCPAIN